MSLSRVDAIAKAVLYEGYMLYPYRPSAIKNRHRFNFGVVVPQRKPQNEYSSELSCITTECLLTGPPQTELSTEARFLQLVQRDVEVPTAESRQFSKVNHVEVAGQLISAWQEAVERCVSSGPLKISELLDGNWRKEFSFAAKSETEPILDDQGRLAARLVRGREALSGHLTLNCSRLGADLFKLTVQVVNTSSFSSEDGSSLRTSLLSANTVLRVSDGAFVSMTDPPEELRRVAETCKNVGTWPVLAGDSVGDSNVMLSSPIILSDYPEIAVESAGDLFDGTEIDEILSLRILTLTDAEKREIRAADDRTRLMLERTEHLSPEKFLGLHGAMRALGPARKEQP